MSNTKAVPSVFVPGVTDGDSDDEYCYEVLDAVESAGLLADKSKILFSQLRVCLHDAQFIILAKIFSNVSFLFKLHVLLSFTINTYRL